MILSSFFPMLRSEFVIHKISELKTISNSNSKLSCEQKIDKNVTRNTVNN